MFVAAYKWLQELNYRWCVPLEFLTKKWWAHRTMNGSQLILKSHEGEDSKHFLFCFSALTYVRSRKKKQRDVSNRNQNTDASYEESSLLLPSLMSTVNYFVCRSHFQDYYQSLNTIPFRFEWSLLCLEIVFRTKSHRSTVVNSQASREIISRPMSIN